MTPCDLCHESASTLHRVLVRPDQTVPWDERGLDYHERLVCSTCYRDLAESPAGVATIDGKSFSIAAVSLAGAGR